MRLSYRWQDLVGMGTFGKVFAAKVTSVDKGEQPEIVALKKARVTNHVRHPILLHEAYFLSLLRGHPNIHNVFAWGRSQYFEYMAMELLGPNIEDFVSTVGLSQRNAVAVVCQMLDALEYIHGNGIVHCDVKPSNICLGRGENAGRLYLLDFGLAWRFTSGSSPPRGQRGTVPYCSLRVLSGETALPRDDLESLAYTLARLLTGNLPWAYPMYQVERGIVRGEELFRGHPDVFASLMDFALGLSPNDDLQYQRLRNNFRALEPRFLGDQCPMFDQQDRSNECLWVSWTRPPRPPSSEEVDQVFVPVEGGEGWYGSRDFDNVFGRPESRSETGGDHGFDELRGSEWLLLPCRVEPGFTIGGELDVVAEHLDFIDEPPLYDGGRSVEDTCPPDVMNNAQSDTHCIRP